MAAVKEEKVFRNSNLVLPTRSEEELAEGIRQQDEMLAKLASFARKYALYGGAHEHHREMVQDAEEGRHRILLEKQYRILDRKAILAVKHPVTGMPLFAYAVIGQYTSNRTDGFSLSNYREVREEKHTHRAVPPPIPYTVWDTIESVKRQFSYLLLLWETENWQEIPVDPALVGVVGYQWFLIAEWELTPTEAEFFC